MKSRRGFAAAIVFLLTLPVAVLCQMLIKVSAETIVHWGLGLGSALLSLAVFDFRTARWVTWIGSVSAGGLAAIFFLQAVSELMQNDSLTYLAFQVFGQWLEGSLVDFFTLWCIAMLLTDSRGKTRILGIVAMSTQPA